uniref:AP2 domain transcription factor AP2VIII-1 n=1 Tax=Neospora caninum (strain Liverpool) TaxID=572307 RepID=A0A0F7UFT9_NEOCL|nr:TPA: AP2 domain transcription factor AP2VIII-1 [Neospora caninum Liverpool]
MAPDEAERWGLATPSRPPARRPRLPPGAPTLLSESPLSSTSLSASPDLTRRPARCSLVSPASAPEASCKPRSRGKAEDGASAKQSRLAAGEWKPRASGTASPNASRLISSAASPSTRSRSSLSPPSVSRSLSPFLPSAARGLQTSERPAGEPALAAGAAALRRHFAELVRGLFSQLAKAGSGSTLPCGNSGSPEAGPTPSAGEPRMQRKPRKEGSRTAGGDRTCSGESSGDQADANPQVAVACAERSSRKDNEDFPALATAWRDLCRDPAMVGSRGRCSEAPVSPDGTLSVLSSGDRDSPGAWSLRRTAAHFVGEGDVRAQGESTNDGERESSSQVAQPGRQRQRERAARKDEAEKTGEGVERRQSSAALPLATASVCGALSGPAAVLDAGVADEESAFHVENILENTERREELAEYANIFAPLFGADPQDLSSHGRSVLHCVALELQILRRTKEGHAQSELAPAGVRTLQTPGEAHVSPCQTPKALHALTRVTASPEQTCCSSSCSSLSSLSSPASPVFREGASAALAGALCAEEGGSAEGENENVALKGASRAALQDGPRATQREQEREERDGGAGTEERGERKRGSNDATRSAVKEILDIPTGAVFGKVAPDGVSDDVLFHFSCRRSQSDDLSALFLRGDCALPGLDHASPRSLFSLSSQPSPACVSSPGSPVMAAPAPYTVRLGTQFALCLDPTERELDTGTPEDLESPSFIWQSTEESEYDGSTFQAPPPELPVLDGEGREHTERVAGENTGPDFFCLALCAAARRASQCPAASHDTAGPFLAFPAHDAVADVARWAEDRRDLARAGDEKVEPCRGRAAFFAPRSASPSRSAAPRCLLPSLAPFGETAHVFSLGELFPLGDGHHWTRASDDFTPSASRVSACEGERTSGAPPVDLPLLAASRGPLAVSDISSAAPLSLAVCRSSIGRPGASAIDDDGERTKGEDRSGSWLSPRSVAVLRQSLPPDTDGPESLLASLRQRIGGWGFDLTAGKGEKGRGSEREAKRSEGSAKRGEEAGNATVHTREAELKGEDLRTGKEGGGTPLTAGNESPNCVPKINPGASSGATSSTTPDEQARNASNPPHSPTSSASVSSPPFYSDAVATSSSAASIFGPPSSLSLATSPGVGGQEGDRTETSDPRAGDSVEDPRNRCFSPASARGSGSHLASHVTLDGSTEAWRRASELSAPLRDRAVAVKTATHENAKERTRIYASDSGARFVASLNLGVEQCSTTSGISSRDSSTPPIPHRPPSSGPPSQARAGSSGEGWSASPLAPDRVSFSVSPNDAPRRQASRPAVAGDVGSPLMSGARTPQVERESTGTMLHVNSGVHTPVEQEERSGCLSSVHSCVCTPGRGSEGSTTATQLSSPSVQTQSEQGSERGDTAQVNSGAFPPGFSEMGERQTNMPMPQMYRAVHTPGQNQYCGGEDAFLNSGVCTPSVGETNGEQHSLKGQTKKRRSKVRVHEKTERLNAGAKWEEARTTGSVSSGGPATAHPVVTIGLVGRPGGAHNLVTPISSETALTTGDFSATRVVRLSNKAMELPYVHGVRFEAEAFAWTAKIGSESRRFLVKKHGFQKSRLCAIEKIQQWRATLSPEALERELEEERQVVASLPADPCLATEAAPPPPEEVSSQRSGASISLEEGEGVRADLEGRSEEGSRKQRRTKSVGTPSAALYNAQASSALSVSPLAQPDVSRLDAPATSSAFSLSPDAQCMYTGRAGTSPELTHAQDGMAKGCVAMAPPGATRASPSGLSASAFGFRPVQQPAYSSQVSPHLQPTQQNTFRSPSFSCVSSTPPAAGLAAVDRSLPSATSQPAHASPASLPSLPPALYMQSPVQAPSPFPGFSVSPPRPAPGRAQDPRDGREEKGESDRMRLLAEYQSRVSLPAISSAFLPPCASTSSPIFPPSDPGGRVLGAPEPAKPQGSYPVPSESAHTTLSPNICPSSASSSSSAAPFSPFSVGGGLSAMPSAQSASGAAGRRACGDERRGGPSSDSAAGRGLGAGDGKEQKGPGECPSSLVQNVLSSLHPPSLPPQSSSLPRQSSSLPPQSPSLPPQSPSLGYVASPAVSASLVPPGTSASGAAYPFLLSPASPSSASSSASVPPSQFPAFGGSSDHEGHSGNAPTPSWARAQMLPQPGASW